MMRTPPIMIGRRNGLGIDPPESVGLQRLNFDQKEFAGMSRDRAKQNTAVAKRVETYLAQKSAQTF